jgi:hypothetical protein
METLNFEQMEQLEGGSCAGALVIGGVVSVGATALLIASGGTGLALAGFFLSRAGTVAGIINACAE